MTEYWKILTCKSLEGEIFKPFYAEILFGSFVISNLGRIRVFGKSYLIPHIGWRTKEGYIKKQSLDSSGYPQVQFRLNGKVVTRKTHRLVAEAFIPNPENKPQINHINSIRTDPRVENLEWCTQSENQIHSFYVHKRDIQNGVNNGKSKLTESQVLEIFNSKRYTIGLSKRFGVHKITIQRIRNGLAWRHLTDPNYELIAKTKQGKLQQQELFNNQ